MAKDNEQQTMEEYLLSQLDSMPGTIERNGIRYRLRISKSGKCSYAVQYKPLDNGTALYELTDSNFKKAIQTMILILKKEGVMT
jgi:hypothetical protein